MSILEEVEQFQKLQEVKLDLAQQKTLNLPILWLHPCQSIVMITSSKWIWIIVSPQNHRKTANHLLEMKEMMFIVDLYLNWKKFLDLHIPPQELHMLLMNLLFQSCHQQNLLLSKQWNDQEVMILIVFRHLYLHNPPHLWTGVSHQMNLCSAFK